MLVKFVGEEGRAGVARSHNPIGAMALSEVRSTISVDEAGF